MTTAQCYTIADFNIMFTKNEEPLYDYSLLPEILQLLNMLESELNIPASDMMKPVKRYNNDVFDRNRSTPSYDVRNKGQGSYNNRSNVVNEITDDDWTTMRSYKATTVAKKDGIERDINTIRGYLNKMSAKNYTVQSDLIIKFLATICADADSDDFAINIRKIAQTFFDIANMNKNNSDIYADLYSTMIEKFAVFSQILDEFIETFKGSIHTIQYVDSNEDYDKFCAYTKTNETRKISARFIVNLMKRSIISKQTVIDIIMHFQTQLFEYIDDESKTNEIEEIGENIFVFISQSHKTLNSHVLWNEQILTNIRKLSTLNPKEHLGISNRALFKCMDILDLLK